MKSSDRGGPFIRRKPSTPHYHTFETPPPRSRGKPPSASSNSSAGDVSSPPSHENGYQGSPLPKRQMAMLAVIALCEQTALNSISPYLPKMASSFPEVDPSQVGVYVGTIASAFALAQFATNFFWGWLSDRIGRKPVILTGTLLTAACFLAFGFCRTLWQAILVQALMGLVNGNQAVVSTCLGEITDRSNQSTAFMYLPVIYGLGGITGPIVGGLLVFQRSPFDPSMPNPYPYLGPNLVSAVVLMVDLLLTMMFLEESLEEARDLPPLGRRVKSLFTWMWQFTSFSTRPTYLQNNGKRVIHYGLLAGNSDTEGDEDVSDADDEDDRDVSLPKLLPPHSGDELSSKDVFNRDTVLLLVTYLIFQLSNISYNSLYPIFASGPTPTGRDLSPREIGLSLAFAGVVTILFQVGVFGKLRERMGNRYTYRAGLAGFVVAFVMMPWVGYKNSKNGDGGMSTGKIWLGVEIGLVLLVKTIAAVGGLTSALLLAGICDSATMAGLLISSLDYQLRSKSFCPRHAEWPCSNSLGGWSCSWAVHFRRPFHPCDEGEAKGGSTGIWRLWRHFLRGLSAEFRD
jgi:MFS family permease